MAEVESAKIPSLAEQYVLPKDVKPVEAPKVESPVSAAPEEATKEADILPTVADESAGATLPPAEESVETPAHVETVVEETKASEETPAVAEEVAEENNVTAEGENEGDQDEAPEETPAIKLETAPADFRFPTTNQTRHCFTRYIEYHRCVAAKGEGAPECDKFAKYYRSLCPGEWVDKWNEQRENGTFPGPL
ncbi:unnamed protein product [Rhodiola kirilowii]